jgi:hypothetical protein
LVLGLFHHEPVDLRHDVFGEDGEPEPANDDFMFANQAFATLLFVDNPAETQRRVTGLSLQSVSRSDFLLYLATGGFSYFFRPRPSGRPAATIEKPVYGPYRFGFSDVAIGGVRAPPSAPRTSSRWATIV